MLHKITNSVRNIFHQLWTCSHTCLMFSFIFAFDGLYEQWVYKVMSIRIVITTFRVLCFDIYVITYLWTFKLMDVYSINQRRPNHVSEFCFLNILTFSTWCITYILVRINYFVSFNRKYKRNVLTNVLHLNKHFFLFLLSFKLETRVLSAMSNALYWGFHLKKWSSSGRTDLAINFQPGWPFICRTGAL